MLVFYLLATNLENVKKTEILKKNTTVEKIKETDKQKAVKKITCCKKMTYCFTERVDAFLKWFRINFRTLNHLTKLAK